MRWAHTLQMVYGFPIQLNQINRNYVNGVHGVGFIWNTLECVIRILYLFYWNSDLDFVKRRG